MAGDYALFLVSTHLHLGFYQLLGIDKKYNIRAVITFLSRLEPLL